MSLSIKTEIHEFMRAGMAADPGQFEGLALRLFAFQFERNAPYRQYCLRRRRTPETVSRWEEIPPIPLSAFKETTLACGPVEGAAACFMSSGTTNAAKRSRHYHPDLTVYDASFHPNFRAHVLPDAAPMKILVLNPDERQMPNSSLAHYLQMAVADFGLPGSGFFVGPDALDAAGLTAALRSAGAAGEPVALLGTPFAFIHYLDGVAERFTLPPGSRIMDTGGFKGRSRAVEQAELYGLFQERFGVPVSRCFTMYGMTELSTQFYEPVLTGAIAPDSFPRRKQGPPWIRTRVVDPITLEAKAPGEVGVLAHYDLGNWHSVLAILTEDAGYAVDGGFVLLGRAQGAEAKGCALAAEELRLAVKSGD